MYYCDHHFTTAVYILMQIVTTVGFGDLPVFVDDASKIFMAFYILLGMLVVAGVIAEVVEKIIRSGKKEFDEKLEKAEALLSGMSEEELDHKYGRSRPLFNAFLLFFAAVMSGTLFFGYFEACTCSYGFTQAEPCNPEGYEQCVKSPEGKQKSYSDAFYMSVVALTSIGFGHSFTPLTRIGRAFSIYWLLFGVLITANFITAFSTYFVQEKKAKDGDDVDKVFDMIDVDNNGSLSKYEFISFCLQKEGMVDVDVLQKLETQFKKLDVRKEGKLQRKDITQWAKLLDM